MVSQHIWIKIGIVLGILFIFEKFSTGMSCMRIRISGQHIDGFRRLGSGWVTGWAGWRAELRWSQLGSPHSASGVRTLRRVGGGSPVSLRLQRVCGFFAVPFWQEKKPDIWL